ncbi:Diacylglycerol kinase theta, partial [Taenia solium]
VVMLAESLEHLDISNVGDDRTGARLNARLITDEHPTISEILLNVPSLNEREEAEEESNLNAYKEKLCSHSGHSFYRKSLSKPVYCHHCGEVIWSPLSTGFACDVCNFLAHEKCLRDIVTVCPSHASTQILTPVAHCWSELTFFRRKFCNVCRTRLRDTPSVRCEVCEYYAHYDCKEFAVNDCKQGAAFRSQRNRCFVGPLSTLFGGYRNRHNATSTSHHWREGNLRSSTKCCLCKKLCGSSECLTGYRCLWCGTTVHAGCSRKLPMQCDFGPLRNIMLPPWAVSFPRPDIPSEHTVGIMRRPQSELMLIRPLGIDYSCPSKRSHPIRFPKCLRAPLVVVDLAKSILNPTKGQGYPPRVKGLMTSN